MYHQLSFPLSVSKFFMIIDDSFSRMTTRMIVDDSFSVSCFLHQRPLDSFSVSSSNNWRKAKQAATLFRREKFIRAKFCNLTRRHYILFLWAVWPPAWPLITVDDSFDYHQLSSNIMCRLTTAHDTVILLFFFSNFDVKQRSSQFPLFSRDPRDFQRLWTHWWGRSVAIHVIKIIMLRQQTNQKVKTLLCRPLLLQRREKEGRDLLL